MKTPRLTESLRKTTEEQSKQAHMRKALALYHVHHARLHETKGNGINLGRRVYPPTPHRARALLLLSGRRATATPRCTTTTEWRSGFTIRRATPWPTNRPLTTLLPGLNDDPDTSLRAIDAEPTLTTSANRKGGDDSFLGSVKGKEFEEGTSFVAHDLDVLDGTKAGKKSRQLLWRHDLGDTLCAYVRVSEIAMGEGIP